MGGPPSAICGGAMAPLAPAGFAPMLSSSLLQLSNPQKALHKDTTAGVAVVAAAATAAAATAAAGIFSTDITVALVSVITFKMSYNLSGV